MTNQIRENDPTGADTWRHNPNCFWCGYGFHVQATDGRAVIDVVLDERFQGGPSFVHGGVLASLIDEVGGQVLGVGAATASLEIRYRAPVEVGRRVLAEARVERRDERGYRAAATIRYPDDPSPRVEATGRFVFVRRPRTDP
jgi:acyl-coenzyme A thioesterase PaaI-like protein